MCVTSALSGMPGNRDRPKLSEKGVVKAHDVYTYLMEKGGA